MHPFLKKISNKHLTNHPLLWEFNAVLERQPTILYYPSSNADISDLAYIDKVRCPSLPKGNPEVFIHSDFFDITSRLLIPDVLKQVDYFIHEGTMLYEIFKFKRKEKTIWLLLISEQYNEAILELFINQKLKVDYIFSCCDGMTSGMSIGSRWVSTAFYPFLYAAMGVCAHITEYHSGWEFTNYSEQAYKKDLLRFLARIENEKLQENIRKNVERFTLGEYLRNFSELQISSKEDLRLILGGNNQSDFIMRVLKNM
jgi:hypothetical protein